MGKREGSCNEKEGGSKNGKCLGERKREIMREIVMGNGVGDNKGKVEGENSEGKTVRGKQ